MNVRSAIIPLVERYRINILSHKLIILGVKSYIDTLFCDDTSLWVNERTQLYTDSNILVYVFLMRSKAKEGESMDNVVKYICIMK